MLRHSEVHGVVTDWYSLAVEILARVRTLIAPPDLPDEDEKRTAATVLRVGLALILIDLIGLFVVAFALPRPMPRVLVSVGFLAVAALAVLLVHRARAQLGGQLLVAAMWLSLAIGLVVSRDAETPALAGFVLAVAGAGLLLGPRAAYSVALASAVAGPLVDYGGLHAATPPGNAHVGLHPGIWLVQASIYFGAAAVVSIAIRYADESRNRARLSEARFRALADNAPDMIAEFDASGRFVYANPPALAGSRLASIDDLRRERIGVWMHPEDAPGLIERFEQLAKEGGSSRAAYRIINDRGQVGWLESTAARFTDAEGNVHVVSVSRDVTREHETAEALRASEERYRLLAENAPDMIVEQDATGRIIYANRKTVEFMGYDQTELAAMEFIDWAHPDDVEACVRAFEEVVSLGRPVRLVHRLRRKDGSYVWVASSGAPLHDARGRSLVVAQSRDLTEELSLQEQLRQSQKMDAIGRLAGGVAHDFNNLLTVIGGYAGMLEMSLEPGATAAAAHEITEATERAAALTRQLLSLSRRQLTQPVLVDLNAAIRGLEPVLRRTLPESILLELSLEPELPAIEVDPSQVDQVMLNLALNARDAIPDHGTLRIDTRRGQGGRFVHLTVSDTGLGMDEDTRARAFEPFFTTKPAGAGTGLGLSTIYGIVRQAGGSVVLESVLGRGTTVEISLPASSRTAPAARERGATIAPGGREAAILLVEDDVSVRRLLAILLESAGYRVTAAANGGEALRLVEASQRRFDLLLTDYVMPGQSGLELCNRLRVRWPDLRVVLMTGHAEIPGKGDTELPLGAELIGKPFTREQLQRVVAGILESA